MIDKNESHKLMDYINNITDKNSPIFKTIGYYLNDQECVEELKEYFNSRLSVLGCIIIVLVNIFLISEIVFLISSDFHIMLKVMFILLLLGIDYVLIKKYKNFMSLSYSYRVIYIFIQKIPKDTLWNIYNKIMKNTDLSN